MSSRRVFHQVALTLSAVVALACGDYSRSTSPTLSVAKLLAARSSFSIVESGTKARAVRWGPAHSNGEQSVSALIGQEGGTLSLPGSDFVMNIPEGALTDPTAITVVSRGGSRVVYDMLPHGLRFLKPVTAIQGLRTTAVYGTDAGNAVRSAYLLPENESIGVDDTASPSEFEAGATYFSGPRSIAETHVWITNHFSRYILISGVWLCVADCDGH